MMCIMLANYFELSYVPSVSISNKKAKFVYKVRIIVDTTVQLVEFSVTLLLVNSLKIDSKHISEVICNLNIFNISENYRNVFK